MSDDVEKMRAQVTALEEMLEQAQEELRTSQRRERELTDQVLCLSKSIAILTNPPPPAPRDPMLDAFKMRL